MILIGQFDSPFVRRCAVTMNVYRIPFERNPLSVFGNIGQVRVHNPLVRVPILLTDEKETLIDSGLIIDYLDGIVGSTRALIPARGRERRAVQQLTAVAHGVAEKVIQLFFERYFHETPHRSADFEKRCIGQIETGLEMLDHHCTDHWMFGERMTHADVMTGCMLGHLQLRVGDVYPDNKYPNLHAFQSRCELNRAFSAARIGANETVPARS